MEPGMMMHVYELNRPTYVMAFVLEMYSKYPSEVDELG